jgi:hypothetical protein
LALIIYSNGIVEESLPIDNVFNDDELIASFSDYPEIRTHRLPEVPNCWCVWGFMDNPPTNEFNKLASEIADADVYSHIIFVHDSELEPNWRLTDNIIYRPYEGFMEQMGTFINEMMLAIATENRQEIEQSEENTSMIFLSTLGHTQDHRVLFSFNPHEQNETFYDDGGWDKFGSKIFEYLSDNFWKEPVEENKPFVIYADAKTIVIIEDKFLDEVIDLLIVEYQSKERYEDCSKISEIKNEWYLRKTIPGDIDLNLVGGSEPVEEKPKKKRGRPPKKKDDEDETSE